MFFFSVSKFFLVLSLTIKFSICKWVKIQAKGPTAQTSPKRNQTPNFTHTLLQEFKNFTYELLQSSIYTAYHSSKYRYRGYLICLYLYLYLYLYLCVGVYESRQPTWCSPIVQMQIGRLSTLKRGSVPPHSSVHC